MSPRDPEETHSFSASLSCYYCMKKLRPIKAQDCLMPRLLGRSGWEAGRGRSTQSTDLELDFISPPSLCPTAKAALRP